MVYLNKFSILTSLQFYFHQAALWTITVVLRCTPLPLSQWSKLTIEGAFFTFLTIVGCKVIIHKSSAQWCVLTISVPLGVGEAPVENSWGSYKIKKCSPEKVSIICLIYTKFGVCPLWTYLFKIWSGKSGFLGRCKNWRFQFQKYKVTCW